ncbi:endonuclease III [Bifidobacterium actinocoloniiforme DSM 22766]|uniref:Endonuclease III n=2 Tax=Bifidobacterium actinocoloniiforme TaxID=638619 RepID=A0A086YVV7_9BIFI|nr:endonuclease III [Bifidobacterium actinocoloniiforme DSM 22766]
MAAAATAAKHPGSWREGKRSRIQRMHQEYEILCEEFPDAVCALDHRDAFELLVATVLSAQTTDKRVNTVTPELFRRFPDAKALAGADLGEVEAIIHPVGFYHAKAVHLIGLSQMLVDDYQGQVPAAMDELVKLPGVGRKTANVVLGNAFGIPGFPVDTHVTRVTARLRWREDWRSTHPDPVRIEREICECFPPEDWTNLSHRLIFHGRVTCHSRKPDCANCPLAASCPSAELFLGAPVESDQVPRFHQGRRVDQG